MLLMVSPVGFDGLHGTVELPAVAPFRDLLDRWFGTMAALQETLAKRLDEMVTTSRRKLNKGCSK
jgi:hypothetical protein